MRSRVGIAAGLLLNSRWTSTYAKLGFDLLTYKTVRSRYRPCHPEPNWVLVDDRGSAEGAVYRADFDSAHPENVTSAVCFGMPSMSPDVWRKDIREARAQLLPGQILIVSVVASPDSQATPAAVAEDFALCAGWAAEAGADVIEANFSCPNVCSSEGSIYLDPKFSQTIAGRIRQTIGEKPLIIKVGDFGSDECMARFLQSVAGAANAVTMVNCLVRPVLNPDQSPVFGEQFRNVGVAGRAIHEPSVELVRTAVEIVQRDQLELAIIAVGGVSRVSDMADFFSTGAVAVLMGSAPMYLPHLAVEAKRLHPEW